MAETSTRKNWQDEYPGSEAERQVGKEEDEEKGGCPSDENLFGGSEKAQFSAEFREKFPVEFVNE